MEASHSGRSIGTVSRGRGATGRESASVPPHRHGGTAAWTFVDLSQAILGIRPSFEGLTIDPCVPADFGDFEITRIYRNAVYRIQVKNPEHVEKGIRFYWERGVRDLYRLVSEEPEMLAGALVADKVVGKGAAALLACGKVSGVYALVMSTPARELLEQNGVEVRCKQEVDHIENRSKTDWCPVEKLCRNLNTPEMCVKEIAKFIASQGQNK